MSLNVSHLEQLVVTKGVQNLTINPLVLVMGDIKNNFSWGLLTIHFIIGMDLHLFIFLLFLSYLFYYL
jgi:hypothetical protein